MGGFASTPQQLITPEQIAQARRRIPLPELIGRDVVLKRRGPGYWGLCPFHKEKTPSFLVQADHYHCFACRAHGNAITWIMVRHNLKFPEAVRELLGLPQRATQARRSVPEATPHNDNKYLEYALSLWNETQAVTDFTAAALYFHSRGISFANLPPDIRYHPRAKINQEDGGGFLPAVVAAVRERAARICAIQVIYVKPQDEVGPDASTQHSGATHLRVRKRTYGRLLDGCVRLGKIDPTERSLGLAEGVETGLSAYQMFFAPVWVTCGLARWGMPAHWSAPDAKGKRYKMAERAPTIWLPADINKIILYADNGMIAHQAADYTKWYWEGTRGIECDIRQPDDYLSDWQDYHRYYYPGNSV
jgi:DNA primase